MINPKLSPSIDPDAPNTELEPRSLWQDAWHRLKANRLAMFGLFFFIGITALSFLGPLFYSLHPHDQAFVEEPISPFSSVNYVEVRFSEGQASPDEVTTLSFFKYLYADDSDELVEELQSRGELEIKGVYFQTFDRFHILGTDSLGRDILARIMQGGRISLGVGFLATIVSLFIGVTYGSISGYLGRRVDAFMMRTVDILYAMPFLIFVILLMVIFQESDYQLLIIFAAIGAVEWLTMARIVRGQVLGLKNMEFVDAARSTGVKTGAIIRRHLIPNLLGPVIVYCTLLVPAVMLLESTLSFLGLGVQAPDSSWGTLIKEGADKMRSTPALLIAPSIFFSLTLFSMNFLGDGLRDALDVKTAKD